MSSELLAYLAAALAWAALIAYAVLGGADFGGGIWDLLASGTRSDRQRQAIARAIGPVWEANNVWIIFVIVVTWTAFPYVYSTVSTALFVPISLAVVGIVLRGAAFGFRAHIRASVGVGRAWGRVFSVTSVITPFFLGTVAGALSSGNIHFHNGQVSANFWTTWTTPFALTCGVFALGLCSVLAATYLTVEAQSAHDAALVGDFRIRAITSGAVTAAIGALAALLAALQAPILWSGLIGRALPLSLGAVLIGLATAAMLIMGRYRAARLLVVGEAVCILAAWAVGLAPYLVVPDLTITNAATASITLAYLLGSSVVGLAIILPSLLFLISVFKGNNPMAGGGASEFYETGGETENERAQPTPAKAKQADGSNTSDALDTDMPHGAHDTDERAARSTSGEGGARQPVGRPSGATADVSAPAEQTELSEQTGLDKAYTTVERWLEPSARRMGVMVGLAVIFQLGRTLWQRVRRAMLRRRVRRQQGREMWR